MQPFTLVRGPALPLPVDDIDTDTIIRIDRLNTVPRGDLGAYAFEALRSQGGPAADALLRPDLACAPVVLAGANFGCGSSREGAVWALAARGVRCVIARSFGDIFQANCCKNGVLPLALDRPALDRVNAHANAGQPLTVDLQAQQIGLADGVQLPFDVDPLQRQLLLAGHDEIDATLLDAPAIDDWQARDRQARPWIWSSPSLPTTPASENP